MQYGRGPDQLARQTPDISSSVDKKKIDVFFAELEKTLKLRLELLRRILNYYFSKGEGKKIRKRESREFVRRLARWYLFRWVIVEYETQNFSPAENDFILKKVQNREATFGSVSVPGRKSAFSQVENYDDKDVSVLIRTASELATEALTAVIK